MSAPNTNIEKQERRHRGPLTGMWIAVAFAVVLFIGWLVWMFALADPAGEPAVTPASGQTETTQPVTTITPDAENITPSSQ